MKKPKLIHCSFDEVLSFEPRVPMSSVEGYEDTEIKRICCAPSVEKCLKAMPQAGEVIRFMRLANVAVIVHAYYLESDRVEYDTSDYVIDALVTDEMWVMDKPKDWKRIDWEITSCTLTEGEDLRGKKIIGISNVQIRRAKYTDNLHNLVGGIGIDYDEWKKQFPKVTFRSLATNLSDEIAEEMARRREKHKKHMAYLMLEQRVAKYREEHNGKDQIKGMPVLRKPGKTG